MSHDLAAISTLDDAESSSKFGDTWRRLSNIVRVKVEGGGWHVHSQPPPLLFPFNSRKGQPLAGKLARERKPDRRMRHRTLCDSRSCSRRAWRESQECEEVGAIKSRLPVQLCVESQSQSRLNTVCASVFHHPSICPPLLTGSTFRKTQSTCLSSSSAP